MKIKPFLTLFSVSVMLMLQGCPPDKPTFDSEIFNFKAVNLSVDDGKLSAHSGSPFVTNTTVVNISVNGQPSTITVTSKSNELSVRRGDEVEIVFTPSTSDETEASFTLPDGSTKILTAIDHTFEWTVPDNFTSGMQIKGETHYETSSAIYHQTGVITLIELK
ncbi:MAG: hypothetical protein K2H46_02330 [Muribaculaceae bacterium]|nr:hypothetical protein [Muribaculaceae bacterium]